MRKIIALMLCAICLFAWCPTSSFALESTNALYIANGATDGDGSIERPFGTFEEAKQAIRNIKATTGLPLGGITVYVRGGEYNIAEGLVLENQDSGAEGAPIVYRNYENEEVVLVGGININGSQFTKTTDEAILSRVYDKNARSKIMEFDFKSIGVTDYGELGYPGAYVLDWLTSVSQSSELFFNDEPMTMARYPNEGFITIPRVIKMGANPRDWWDDRIGQATYVEPEDRDRNDVFIIGYEEGRIDNWVTAKEAKLYGMWMYDWADQTVDLASVDPKAKSITAGQPSMYQVKEGGRYYAYNLIEELDAPGEYFLDHNTGILYFYPPTDLSSAKLQYSLLTDAYFRLDNAHYVTISGLTMAGTRGRAVEILNGASHNRVEYCTIKNTAGKTCIYISGTENGVVGCDFYNVNGGIDMTGGDKETLTHGNNFVESCRFEKFSRIVANYNPAVQVRGVGNRISNCEMSNVPHMAIGFDGQEHIIEYNHIYNVLLDSSDAGAIYGGRDITARGNIFRYNYIHDIHDTTGHTYAHAIYFDDCYSSAEIYGNIFENISSPALMLNGGRDFDVRNNIFINSAPLWITSSGITISAANFQAPNGIFWQEWNKDYITSATWMEKYPEVYEMYSDDPSLPKYNTYANNVEIGCTEHQLTAEAIAHGIFKNNLKLAEGEDPGFVNMAKKDYNLREDASVYTQVPGFAPIDFSAIGPYSLNPEEKLGDCVIMLVDSANTFVNGEQQLIDEENPNVVATVVNDRTVVPVRFVSETFGAIVKWDAQKGEVSVKNRGNSIVFPLDENAYYYNGERIETETGAVIINDRVLVPIRVICDALSQKVYYNPKGLIAIYTDETAIDALSEENVLASIINNLR